MFASHAGTTRTARWPRQFGTVKRDGGINRFMSR